MDQGLEVSFHQLHVGASWTFGANNVLMRQRPGTGLSIFSIYARTFSFGSRVMGKMWTTVPFLGYIRLTLSPPDMRIGGEEES